MRDNKKLTNTIFSKDTEYFLIQEDNASQTEFNQWGTSFVFKESNRNNNNKLQNNLPQNLKFKDQDF